MVCRGRFSEDTKRRFRSEDKENPGALLVGTCETCGRRGLVAKNYGGNLLPETHDALPKRRAYKSGGYKS
jgi:hypothetical protein